MGGHCCPEADAARHRQTLGEGSQDEGQVVAASRNQSGGLGEDTGIELQALTDWVEQHTMERSFDFGGDRFFTVRESGFAELPMQLRRLAALAHLEDALIANYPALQRVQHLKNFRLSEKPLTKDLPEIGCLTFVKLLVLQNNQLRNLSPEIGNLVTLLTLDLSNNQLWYLPSEIGNLAALERLHLSNNRLQNVPLEIGNLAALKSLDLSNNRLQNVPVEIGNLASLTYLTIANNRLLDIPAEIGKVTALHRLNLSNNRLQHIPAELGNLPKLACLFLGNNQLCALPTTLNSLIGMRYLHIENNGIKGTFTLRPLFERMMADPDLQREHGRGLSIGLSGNDFDAVDFGDERWTTGTLRDPRSERGPFDHCYSVCAASFCGAEFLEWQLLLMRTKADPWWSQLCVFLKEYASAADRDEAPVEWHAQGLDSSVCRHLGSYFQAADSFTGGRTSEAHRKFGCCWFQKWTANIDSALQMGHRRFVVFTKVDRTVGVCQTVEWLYLLQAKEEHPDINLQCASVADASILLRVGPIGQDLGRAFARGNGAQLEFFKTPSCLPSSLVGLSTGLPKRVKACAPVTLHL